MGVDERAPTRYGARRRVYSRRSVGRSVGRTSSDFVECLIGTAADSSVQLMEGLLSRCEMMMMTSADFSFFLFGWAFAEPYSYIGTRARKRKIGEACIREQHLPRLILAYIAPKQIFINIIAIRCRIEESLPLSTYQNFFKS